MRTQNEHIKTLQRRVDFLKAREFRNSYDAAELGALEWAIVNLPPTQRDTRNQTLDEIADKIALMPFGDTAASFAVWIREQKT